MRHFLLNFAFALSYVVFIDALICSDVGDFADVDDCAGYFQCSEVGEAGVPMKCEFGLFFNEGNNSP